MDNSQDGDKRHHRPGSTRRQYLAAFLASMLAFCSGMEIGWPSPIIPLLISPNPPIGSEPMTMEQMALISSINMIGAAFGTFFWGPLADKVGRKPTVCLVAIPHIISWIVIFFAQDLLVLLIGRFIVGFGMSGCYVTGTVFITEISQDDLRGFFGCFIKIADTSGILCSYILGTYLGYHGLALSGLVAPVVFLLTFVWLPETPLFYWKDGQPDKAEKSLLWYRCGDVYATERTLLTYKSLQNKKTKKSLKHLVSTRGRIKALMAGTILAIAFQTTGIATLLSYAVKIFQMSGVTFSPYYSAIIFGVVQLVFTIVSSLLVERLGRKLLVVGSLTIISISLVILGSYLFLFQGTVHHRLLDFVPLVTLCIHIMAFSAGFGSVFFVYKTEIFPPEIRGIAMSATTLVSVLSSFAFVTIFPIMERYLNLYGVFWFYGISSCFFAIIFKFFMIETKGRAQSVIVKQIENLELTVDEKESELRRKGRKHSFVTELKENITVVA